jgi:hypothetical protein
MPDRDIELIQKLEDLRQPLTLILGRTSLSLQALKGQIDEEAYSSLEEVCSAAKTLNADLTALLQALGAEA